MLRQKFQYIKKKPTGCYLSKRREALCEPERSPEIAEMTAPRCQASVIRVKVAKPTAAAPASVVKHSDCR
jgi:hypothetical protein